jgi:uncharacterized ParB-like nuclease family protein
MGWRVGRGGPRPLSIADLDLSLVECVRASTSTEAIEDYAAQLDHLPPIRVALVDNGHVVVGGLHRVRAHERAGRLEIPCIVELMTWAEAVRSAVADNRIHGLRMTRADKRAAIMLLLAEDPGLSSRAIAALVGCSHSTVETVRTQAAEPPAFSGPDETQVANLASCSPLEAAVPSPAAPPPPELPAATPDRHGVARKGRDGKTYRLKPGRSGEAVTKASSRPMPLVAAAGLPAPPVDSPALFMDFRRGVRWMARFLKLALRSPAREHRAEALDELREALTADELRGLAAWFEEAAVNRGAASSHAGAAAAVY